MFSWDVFRLINFAGFIFSTVFKVCNILKYSETYGSIANETKQGYNYSLEGITKIFDALRELVRFVQFKKRENHPWNSVTFSKVAGLSLQLY